MVFNNLFHQLLIIILLTIIPGFELRASIPYGLLSSRINWFLVIIFSVFINIVIGIIVYYLLSLLVDFMLRFSLFKKFYSRIIIKPRKKIKKYVDKWGEIGIALFIGIPLPGSGVYTAALGAYVLGISKKDFFKATIIGVIIAGFLVSLITLSGNSFFEWVVKK